MHDSSMFAMSQVASLLQPVDPSERLKIVDIGSLDVNGCYKPLFAAHDYTGYDMAAGKNVDVVGTDLYHFPFANGEFDVAISGQTIEHVADIYAWIREVARIVRVDGMVVIIAPNMFHEHRFPIDCWRIFPDGMSFLMKDVAGLEVLKVWKHDINTIGLGRKL